MSDYGWFQSYTVRPIDDEIRLLTICSLFDTTLNKFRKHKSKENLASLYATAILQDHYLNVYLDDIPFVTQHILEQLVAEKLKETLKTIGALEDAEIKTRFRQKKRDGNSGSTSTDSSITKEDKDT